MSDLAEFEKALDRLEWLASQQLRGPISEARAEVLRLWEESQKEIGEHRAACLNAHHDLGYPEWGNGPAIEWPRKARIHIVALRAERGGEAANDPNLREAVALPLPAPEPGGTLE